MSGYKSRRGRWRFEVYFGSKWAIIVERPDLRSTIGICEGKSESLQKLSFCFRRFFWLLTQICLTSHKPDLWARVGHYPRFTASRAAVARSHRRQP
jgi:hypothetical protein